jgi:hypothetical protein
LKCLYAGAFFGQICGGRRDDDLIQGELLLGETIHAKQAEEMGNEGVVHGKFYFKVCV